MSGLGRYIVDAVILEGRSPTQIARDHGISERWVFKLLKRFREGGYSSLEPRSRRPRSCPHQVDAKLQDLIVKLRFRECRRSCAALTKTQTSMTHDGRASSQAARAAGAGRIAR